MIEVKNIFHDYSGQGKYALNDVSFQIKKGEIFGFLGPNGAGKTTLQNVLTRILPLQKGEVFFDGVSVNKIKDKFFNKVGVSFEYSNLYSKLTGYENLKFYAGLFDEKTKDIDELLEMVELKNDAKKLVAEYSKGMKQRLVFARSLIGDPEILFLDEPLAGLDPNSSQKLKKIIKKKKEEGCTIFLTTHNMFVAEELCDRVAFLNEGKIVAEDEPRKLKLQHGEKSVAVEFLENKKIETKIFFLEKENDKKEFKKIIDDKNFQTIHSKEATLEQIFIKLTGKKLS